MYKSTKGEKRPRRKTSTSILPLPSALQIQPLPPTITPSIISTQPLDAHMAQCIDPLQINAVSTSPISYASGSSQSPTQMGKRKSETDLETTTKRRVSSVIGGRIRISARVKPPEPVVIVKEAESPQLLDASPISCHAQGSTASEFDLEQSNPSAIVSIQIDYSCTS